MRLQITCLLLALMLLGACRAPEPEGYPITLVADGAEHAFIAQGPTVREALVEGSVTLADLDRVEPPEFTPLQADMTIRVIRVTQSFTMTQETIPFERRTVRNESLPAGETRLLQTGANGRRELTWRITAEDGREVDRRVVREVVLTQPTDEVVMVGSRGTVVPIPISGTLIYLSGGNPWIVKGNSALRRPLDASGDLDGRVFALAPDGQHLAYTRAAPVMTGTAPSLLNTLWLAGTADRSRPARTAITGALSLTWAPDGEAFAYSTGERVAQPPGWQANNDLWQATLDDAGGVQRERLLDSTPGGAYSWWGTQYAYAPGGDLLAFARADAVGTFALPTHTARVLASFSPFRTYSDWVWAPAPAWSSDGQFIFVALHGPPPPQVAPEDSRVFDLWALSPRGGLAMKVAPDSGMWAFPVPSEWGIAYLQALSPDDSALGQYALYVMDRDGSNRRRVFPPEGAGLKPQQVVWSPTGREIALTYGGDIYLVDVATGAARQLTSDGQSSNPQWGP